MQKPQYLYLRAWYRSCFCHAMTNLITHTDRLGEPQEDVLPAHASRTAFLWTRTSKVREVWDILRATRLWPDIVIAPDPSGLCFAANGYSLAHLGWDGRLDLPFGQEVVDEAAAMETSAGKSDRAVFQVHTSADVDVAVKLLRLAYLIVDSKSPCMCG